MATEFTQIEKKSKRKNERDRDRVSIIWRVRLPNSVDSFDIENNVQGRCFAIDRLATRPHFCQQLFTAFSVFFFVWFGCEQINYGCMHQKFQSVALDSIQCERANKWLCVFRVHVLSVEKSKMKCAAVDQFEIDD